MFLLEGIPSILVGFIVLFYLDDRIAKAQWLTPEDKSILERKIASEDAEKEDPPLLAVLSSPRVWLMSTIYFCLVAGLYGVSFWLPTIIKSTGVKDNFVIGVLSAVPYAFAVVAMIIASHSADARRERRWHVAVPALLGALGLVLGTEHRPGDGRTHARDDGHPHHVTLVLEPADRFSCGHGGRGRHRSHQFARQSRGLREPLRSRVAEGCDPEHRRGDVRSCGRAGARCITDAERSGTVGEQVTHRISRTRASIAL
jgi:hypothetical protein